MSDNLRFPSKNGAGQSRFLPSRRTIGILVMVAGAAAFFYSQVKYTDQLLCLGGSTLIVFAGLGIILSARRTDVGSATTQQIGQGDSGESVPVFRRGVPRGLRGEARRRPRVQPPAIASAQARPVEPPINRTPLAQSVTFVRGQGTLLDKVITLLNEQGAQVAIETQREDAAGSRGILQVQSAAGQFYKFMVLESEDLVDVVDVRALFALVNSSGSAGGYLVASSPFSERAYEWAGPRHIHLVRDDELEELNL